MVERVGIGVVGVGSIGIRGVLNHVVLPDVQTAHLAAVCDNVPERARAAADKYGAPAYYENYDLLLRDPRVQAVTLCTPIGLHYEQTMKAIVAGKHVHVNKTMTTTKAEADKIIAAARAAGIKVVASPGRAHGKPVTRTREIIQSGELGRIYWAETGFAGAGHEYEGFRGGDDILSNVTPAWYYQRPGGGPMYDMVVYALHVITGILGPAKRVTGFSGIGLKERFFKGEPLTVEMDDNTHLLLDFGDSVFALVYGSNSFTGPARGNAAWFISGSEGALASSRTAGLEIWRRGGAETHRVEPIVPDYPYLSEDHAEKGERHTFSDLLHLVDCILYDKQPAISAEHARHVIEIIELGYNAAATGVAQPLTTAFELRALTVGPS